MWLIDRAVQYYATDIFKMKFVRIDHMQNVHTRLAKIANCIFESNRMITTSVHTHGRYLFWTRIQILYVCMHVCRHTLHPVHMSNREKNRQSRHADSNKKSYYFMSYEPGNPDRERTVLTTEKDSFVKALIPRQHTLSQRLSTLDHIHTKYP